MPYLQLISDEDLVTATKNLLDKAANIKVAAERTMHRNVVDPFSSIFQIVGFELNYDEWLTGEITRQAQKSLQNHVGDFHQNILGCVEGWVNKRTGNVIDLVNDDKKIIAEVKNKHNTVKGSDLVGLYDTLELAVEPKMSIYNGYMAYYVTIIPNKAERINKPFVPSDNKKGQRRAENEDIRIIDGASFYELVTGDLNALRNLFSVLPRVISNQVGRVFDAKEIEVLTGLFDGAYGDV